MEEQIMYCSHCGKELRDEKFCSNCGHQCTPDENTNGTANQNEYDPSMGKEQVPKRTSKTLIVVLIVIIAAIAIIPIIIVIIVSVYITRHSEKIKMWENEVYEHNLMQKEETYEYPKGELDRLLEDVLK